MRVRWTSNAKPANDVPVIALLTRSAFRRRRSSGLVGGRLVGAFDEFAVLELRASAHERDQVGALTARQPDWAASISLNAMTFPAAREPGPLVILLRLRTVAKVDSGWWCAGGPSAGRGSRKR